MLKIDINTAGKKELESLPAIGNKLSTAILIYRDREGSFRDLQELLSIKGFTQLIFDTIKDHIQILPNYNLMLPKTASFNGFSNRMSSRLSVRNLGGKKIRKITVKVQDTDLEGIIGCGGDTFVVRQSILPGQNCEVTLHLPVNPYAPSGSYTGNIMINEQSVKATFNVAERVNITINPPTLYLVGLPGQTIEKKIFITNQSNSQLTFNDPGAVVIESDYLECRVIRGIVKQSKEFTNLDTLLNVAAKELEKQYKEAGMLRVKLAECVELPPGETKLITLKIVLPSTLMPSVNYSGGIRFYNSSLRIFLSVTKNTKINTTDEIQ